MTWEEEAAAIIAKIDQTIPAEADIKERKRALREGRVRQYRQQHPEGIELVVSVPGDRDLEAVLLEHLSGSNSVGEWFEPTMEVLSMVETLERVAKRRRR